MKPAWMTPERKDNRATGNRHEKRIGKMLGKEARAQPGSGAISGLKGDFDWWGTENDGMTAVKIEAKSSIQAGKKSFSIKKSWLEKIFVEAVSNGMIPMMLFEILGMPGSVPRDWALVPVTDKKTLKKIIRTLSRRSGGRT